MTATVAILSGNHLCHNPRVVKEATSLADAGYRVVVLGAWFDAELKARDEAMLEPFPATFLPVVDLTSDRASARVQHLIVRARTKAIGITRRFRGGEGDIASAPLAKALAQAAIAVRADLSIAHSEAALPVARGLLASGRRVGVDMEDWFSEDLLPEVRKQRPVRVLRDLEQEILRRGAYAACPSSAMSEALAQEYVCPAPTVIYNAFPWSDRDRIDGCSKDRGDRRRPSIHWFSQTLGAGRGLEDLLAALPYLRHDVEIHLRGTSTAAFQHWLGERLPTPWRDRVRVHPLVRNSELLSRVAEHDIGFAGEMKYSRSRDLTVTNKILVYLLGGLAVVASDTAGQTEIARHASGAVSLYRSGDGRALAARLDAWLGSPERLRQAKVAALTVARETFCWEKHESRLLDAVARALATDTARTGTL